jgi:SAM-dependent MidA family methyltransferase
VRTISTKLEAGVALFIDYGFPQREYYHPQRSMGTLRCHYRHRFHGDPFFMPGLQDITAHVDFTAMARAAESGGRAHRLHHAGLLPHFLRPRGAGLRGRPEHDARRA